MVRGWDVVVLFEGWEGGKQIVKMEPIAIEKLRLYEPKKAALENIPMEIRRASSPF